MFSIVDKELGAISVLVNNAGILKQQSRLEEMTADRINEILFNNVTSYFICSREVVNVCLLVMVVMAAYEAAHENAKAFHDKCENDHPTNSSVG